MRTTFVACTTSTLHQWLKFPYFLRKHQTSIIEKTREDAQKAALDLDVGYDKSRSSSSDSSLTDLDEDEDATSATGDLDGPPAVGSRFVRPDPWRFNRLTHISCEDLPSAISEVLLTP